MAVLIDEPRWWFRGRRWSHLVSDTSLDELHAFAARAGIPRRGFQGDHYDVPEDYRRRCSSSARSSWRAASSSAASARPACGCRPRNDGERPADGGVR